MNKLLVICGPTASGKTQIALDLAKKFNGELISADSRQVYKGMDIGTGKDLPKQATMSNEHVTVQWKRKQFQLSSFSVEGIPLWMVDIVDPDEEFSVSCFEKLARAVGEDILKRGKLPIIVGGTGLYISSLLSPIETSHIPPNREMRDELSVLNLQDLQNRLQMIDLPTWNMLNESDRKNSRRLIRKIEIAIFERDSKTLRFEDNKTGKSAGAADFAKATTARKAVAGKLEDTKDVLLVGLTASYPILYERIDARVEKRIQEGIIAEISSLLKKGYSWELPAMNTFGYKEWKEFFKPSVFSSQLLDKEKQSKIIERWKFDEHGYARRQMTWFKKLKGIQWFDISDKYLLEKVETCVNQWYTR
jgi:tRNA dimethylallyltransferase